MRGVGELEGGTRGEQGNGNRAERDIIGGGRGVWMDGSTRYDVKFPKNPILGR